MDNLSQLTGEQKDRIISTRRELHKIPETAYTEKRHLPMLLII
jgi:metal-dependent amidase/aminoacylase/carboxypeptidase family protein